jgi:hypothetical protein
LFPLIGESKKNKNQALISIGDGGNEVGMGKVSALIKANVNNGVKIYANTTCEHLIVTDTSNYGAYALIGAISIEMI